MQCHLVDVGVPPGFEQNGGFHRHLGRTAPRARQQETTLTSAVANAPLLSGSCHLSENEGPQFRPHDVGEPFHLPPLPETGHAQW